MCLGNRQQEVSDELLDTRVETDVDRGAEPGVQQAAQLEDESVAEDAEEVLEEWEEQGAYSKKSDPDKFLFLSYVLFKGLVRSGPYSQDKGAPSHSIPKNNISIDPI